MTPTESQNPSLVSMVFAPELRAFRGQTPLPVVFWGYGVAVSTALAILLGLALASQRLLSQQVLILVSGAYTLWILVAIWQCAANAQPFWGAVARWLTLAWGINTGLVLLFLQIELLETYAGA